MCNASNHRPGCQCGWGGGYSGGVLSSSFQIYAGVPKIVARYESFVNPNASCPVCGENVYFYQSPLGGRVFFDNLGPPWPKHGCTNNTSIPKQIAPSQKPSQKKYSWQKNGWHPLLISHIHNRDKHHLCIECEHEQKTINLFIKKDSVSLGEEPVISTSTIAHIKKINDDEYKLSFLFGLGDNKTIIAYRRLPW
ncbi:hypothetical protein ACWIJ6_13285 [Aeromonas piscicola]